MNDIHDIEKKIESAHAPLSSDARARMWAEIGPALVAPRAVPSPYVFLSRIAHVRTLVPVTLALIVIVGLGGTAVASESARPGDVLFPVDRAIETVRIQIAHDDAARATLARTFADERLHELSDLIDDDSLTDDSLRNARIDTAVAQALALMDASGEVDESFFDDVADRLRDANVEVRDERIRARWDEDRFEVRTDRDDRGHDDDEGSDDHERTRIEYRTEDGERVRIESEDDDVRIDTSQSGSSEDDDRTDGEVDAQDDRSADDASIDDSDSDVRAEDRDDSSGSGSGEDEHDDSSGSGSGKDDNRDDRSGSGSGSDDPDDA